MGIGCCDRWGPRGPTLSQGNPNDSMGSPKVPQKIQRLIVQVICEPQPIAVKLGVNNSCSTISHLIWVGNSIRLFTRFQRDFTFWAHLWHLISNLRGKWFVTISDTHCNDFYAAFTRGIPNKVFDLSDSSEIYWAESREFESSRSKLTFLLNWPYSYYYTSQKMSLESEIDFSWLNLFKSPLKTLI